MVAFNMRPHSFTVTRNDGANQVPPTSTPTVILSGACNNQTSNNGGVGSENTAMDYDYVLFHDEEILTEIKAEDTIVVNHLGKIINGVVKKSLPGQLSERIWYNETSK